MIDPITVVYYIRNTGLTLNADLALMDNMELTGSCVELKCGAHRLACWVETRSSQARVLSWKRGATQARVLRSSATVAFSTERDPHVCCWWSVNLVFELKCDPRIDMRPASEAFSSVIFRQPTEGKITHAYKEATLQIPESIMVYKQLIQSLSHLSAKLDILKYSKTRLMLALVV